MEYPIQDIIKEKLDLIGQTTTWLALELGVERRTVYNFKKFKEISLERILKMSELLQFNLLADYLKQNNIYSEEHISVMLADHQGEYRIEPKSITTSFMLISNMDNYEKNYIKLLKDIEKTADKHGFELK